MRVGAVIVALALGVAGPVWAQRAAAQADRAAAPPAVLYLDRNCTDEYGRDLCAARIRDVIVRAFGLTPAEALTPGDAPQFRVFIIDGYSRDLPALVFTGVNGGEARVEVYSQMAAPARGGPSFRLPLGADDARAARELADAVRRSPEKITPPPTEKAAPRAPGLPPPPPPPPCLHGWATFVEVLDAGGLTRRIRNACQFEPIFSLAVALGDRALAGLPQCRALAGGPYRSAFHQLDACATLSGDMAAAAAVRLKLDDWGVRSWEGAADPGLPDLLADRVALRLPEREVVGAVAAARALDAVRGVQFSSRVHASSDSAVEVTAEIMKREDKDGVGRAFFAPVTQRWVRIAGEWRIAAMEVGPYAPPARPDQEVTGIWGE